MLGRGGNDDDGVMQAPCHFKQHVQLVGGLAGTECGEGGGGTQDLDAGGAGEGCGYLSAGMGEIGIMNEPLVSIAMSVRNCGRTVAMAVQSILNQTFSDWELIIINNGSTDETLSELAQFRDSRIAIYSDGESKGLPARLNEALSLASGTYFARMDGDDVSYPRRLELQLAYLRLHREVDVLGGGVMVFGKDGCALGIRMAPECHSKICCRPYGGFSMAHPTFFGKTDWFRRFGYREIADRCEDQDLLLRAFRTSRYANLPCIVLGYHEQLNLSVGKILRSRRFFARMVLAEYVRHGEYWIGYRGVVEQILKGAVDVMAVLTGMQYRLLRHRALPANSEEIATWKEVWNSVNLKKTKPI